MKNPYKNSYSMIKKWGCDEIDTTSRKEILKNGFTTVEKTNKTNKIKNKIRTIKNNLNIE